MSSLDITQYPVLTQDLFEKLGFTIEETEYSYQDSNGFHPLKGEPTDAANSQSTIIELTSSSGNWHPDTCPLDIEVKASIKSPGFLFKKNRLDSGIILNDPKSVLGVAIQWTDKEARIRGAEPVTTITSQTGQDFEFCKSIHFDPGMLRGILTLRVILYVVNSVQPEKVGMHFAETPGTVLGILDEIKIVIEGGGSVFPVKEVDAPGEPLWWLKTYIDDPAIDQFGEDHLILCLNKAHKDFEHLHLTHDDKEEDKDSPLMREILASAYFTLIMQTLTYPDSEKAIRGTLDSEPGSICRILRYTCLVNHWMNYLNSPAELNKAIHEMVDKRG